MAYYMAERPLSGHELRTFLEELLPPHMIPQQFVQLAELPYNANRKLDVRALPEPQNMRPELHQAYLAPRNDTEQRIAAIWQDVLGMDQVGVEDGFFELGGDSLLAMQVLNRTREVTQTKLSFRHLFERQTVAKLAELVQAVQQEKVSVDCSTSLSLSRQWFPSLLFNKNPVPITRSPWPSKASGFCGSWSRTAPITRRRA